MQAHGIENVLISQPSNRRYVSRFTGTRGYLFIASNRQIIFSDSRYEKQISKESPEFEFQVLSRDKTVFQLINELKCDELGVESHHLTYDQYLAFQEETNVKIVPMGKLVEKLRIIKDDDEIASIKKAAQIADMAFKNTLHIIKPGISEIDVATELEYQMRLLGASGTSFDTLVGSGYRGALPHAQATQKKIADGEFIVIDFGCIYEGYCSDMTRTIHVGKATSDEKRLYDIVLKANLEVISQLRGGVISGECDRIAREVIEGYGFGDNFAHGLGHGVGLDVHEEPLLTKNSQTVLKSNMIVTNEPGIYFPGRLGIRIEDLILIHENSCEILSFADKELIEII